MRDCHYNKSTYGYQYIRDNNGNLLGCIAWKRKFTRKPRKVTVERFYVKGKEFESFDLARDYIVGGQCAN